jgi:chromosome partitioning protein
VGINDAIVPTEYGVHLVPSTVAVGQYDEQGLGPNGDQKIRRLIRDIDPQQYDIILIDTPQHRGRLFTAGLFAADSVIAIVLVGAAEISALEQLDQDMVELQDSSDEAGQIDFVILTQHRDHYRVAKDMRISLTRDWGEAFIGTVSASVKVVEAGLANMPVIDYAPDSYPAQDYLRISKTISERLALR